jgi:sterol desaturase/sphingolipid hydroxylase (fatty acid hydroxylase superfamily)
MPRNFVSNKDETVALFQSPFLEKFTRVHYSVPLIVYLPVISWLLYRASRSDELSTAMVLFLLLAGFLTWTFTEYILHRFVFHYMPKSPWGKRLHFLMHGVHHDYPNDSWRLVMPPSVSIPLALLFYGLFLLIFGPVYVLSFFAGFLLGYLAYDMIHYATHHAPMKGGVGLLLKHHHMKHHYQTDTLGYGVSSPLWDYVFGTMFTEKGNASSTETLPGR